MCDANNFDIHYKIMGSRRKWEDQVTAAYIRDDHFAWLPVNIVSKTNDAEALVKVSLPEDWHKVTCNSKHHSFTKSDESNKDGHVLRKVILNDYIGNTLPLRSADEDDNSWYKIDIGDLSFIHEASILYNLRHFHSKGIPYTRVNDVVISMNPFHVSLEHVCSSIRNSHFIKIIFIFYPRN